MWVVVKKENEKSKIQIYLKYYTMIDIMSGTVLELWVPTLGEFFAVVS